MSTTALAAATVAPAHHAVAAGTKMVDFAERQVSVEQIAAAGYAGVIVYVSQLRPGATFDFKPVSRSYTDALHAAGLHVASVYQYGKPDWINSPSDFTRGFDGGVADANTALSLHTAAGGPDSAPIFSVSTKMSALTPGKVLRPSGSRASTRYWVCSARVSTVVSGRSPGPPTTA